MDTVNEVRKLDPRGFAAALAVERGFVCVEPGVLAIPLKRGRGRKQLVEKFALLSEADKHLASYHWSDNRHGYVRRRQGTDGRCIFLHREVAGLRFGDERVVDHINRDRMDSRRENLRILDGQSQNMQNMGSKPGSSSKYRGVSWRKSASKWYAYCRLNGKMVGLGLYDDEDEAGRVAAAFRAEHMPFSSDASAV